MGHSSSNDITSNYIGTYPLEKMIEYNSYLLYDVPSKDELKKIQFITGLNRTKNVRFSQTMNYFLAKSLCFYNFAPKNKKNVIMEKAIIGRNYEISRIKKCRWI